MRDGGRMDAQAGGGWDPSSRAECRSACTISKRSCSARARPGQEESRKTKRDVKKKARTFLVEEEELVEAAGSQQTRQSRGASTSRRRASDRGRRLSRLRTMTFTATGKGRLLRVKREALKEAAEG